MLPAKRHTRVSSSFRLMVTLAASDDKEYRRLQAWIAGRHHIDWQPYEEHLWVVWSPLQSPVL